MMPNSVPDFSDWSRNNGSGRFTDWLRDCAEPDWEQTVYHRFTEDLANGTIEPAVMARYLVQDYTFLDAFVVLLGAAVAAAPSLDDRIPTCQFLALATGDENTYFQRSFEALGVSAADRAAAPLEPVTLGFQNIMREAAASGSYANMIAVLTVAEWSYFSWADRVKSRRPDTFWLGEWIDLHSGDDFEAWVGFLRAQLDRDGPALPDGERAACRDFFVRAVGLEKAFFEMAYET